MSVVRGKRNLWPSSATNCFKREPSLDLGFYYTNCQNGISVVLHLFNFFNSVKQYLKFLILHIWEYQYPSYMSSLTCKKLIFFFYGEPLCNCYLVQILPGNRYFIPATNSYQGSLFLKLRVRSYKLDSVNIIDYRCHLNFIRW